MCLKYVIELLGTHIFLVIVSQGEFSLWQYELPLQKLCVLFPFLPQHAFIETWIQYKKHWVTGAWTHTGLTQNERVLVLKPNIFYKGDNPVSFHFLVQRTGFSYTVLLENEELHVYISLKATDVCSVLDKCVGKHHLLCMKLVDTWFLPWIPSFHI